VGKPGRGCRVGTSRRFEGLPKQKFPLNQETKQRQKHWREGAKKDRVNGKVNGYYANDHGVRWKVKGKVRENQRKRHQLPLGEGSNLLGKRARGKGRRVEKAEP